MCCAYLYREVDWDGCMDLGFRMKRSSRFYRGSSPETCRRVLCHSEFGVERAAELRQPRNSTHQIIACLARNGAI